MKIATPEKQIERVDQAIASAAHKAGRIAGLKQALEIEIKWGHIASKTAVAIRECIAELEKIEP